MRHAPRIAWVVDPHKMIQKRPKTRFLPKLGVQNSRRIRPHRITQPAAIR